MAWRAGGRDGDRPGPGENTWSPNRTGPQFRLSQGSGFPVAASTPRERHTPRHARTGFGQALTQEMSAVNAVIPAADSTLLL